MTARSLHTFAVLLWCASCAWRREAAAPPRPTERDARLAFSTSSGCPIELIEVWELSETGDQLAWLSRCRERPSHRCEARWNPTALRLEASRCQEWTPPRVTLEFQVEDIDKPYRVRFAFVTKTHGRKFPALATTIVARAPDGRVEKFTGVAHGSFSRGRISCDPPPGSTVKCPDQVVIEAMLDPLRFEVKLTSETAAFFEPGGLYHFEVESAEPSCASPCLLPDYRGSCSSVLPCEQLQPIEVEPRTTDFSLGLPDSFFK